MVANPQSFSLSFPICEMGWQHPVLIFSQVCHASEDMVALCLHGSVEFRSRELGPLQLNTLAPCCLVQVSGMEGAAGQASLLRSAELSPSCPVCVAQPNLLTPEVERGKQAQACCKDQEVLPCQDWVEKFIHNQE